jgi:hypothetical protein
VVEILSDMLRNPSFPDDQLEKLRSETLSEMEQEKENPDARAQRLFRSTVFPAGHPYHPQTIEEDAKDLQSSRGRTSGFTPYYGPDTAVIVSRARSTAAKPYTVRPASAPGLKRGRTWHPSVAMDKPVAETIAMRMVGGQHWFGHAVLAAAMTPPRWR